MNRSIGCTISDFVEPLPLPKGGVLSERECQAQACALQGLLNATNNLSHIRVLKTRNHKVDNSIALVPEPFGRTTPIVPALFDDLLDACPGSRGNIRSAVEHARNGRNRDAGLSGELSNCTAFG